MTLSTLPLQRSHAERCPKCGKRYVYLDEHRAKCEGKTKREPNAKRAALMHKRWADPAARERVLAALRASWADPERRQQRVEAISQGVTDYWRRNPNNRARQKPRRGDKCLLSVWVAHDTHRQLIQRTRKHCCSMSEVVRTYIDWGLETEGEDT